MEQVNDLASDLAGNLAVQIIESDLNDKALSILKVLEVPVMLLVDLQLG